MNRHARHALLLCAGALCGWTRSAAAGPTVPAALAPLLQDAGDRQVNRAFVPSPQDKVGEVRLLRRGDADVVQTLLYTKILRRVVGEIRKKERANWPPGVAGQADAERYIEALSQAQETVWARVPKFDRSGNPLQTLLIELILSERAAVVLLASYEAMKVAGEIQVTARQPLAVLELSRPYVHRNMRLIVADSFGVSEAELGKVLDGLSWVAEPPASATPAASDGK
jgi:hypothetical protein